MKYFFTVFILFGLNAWAQIEPSVKYSKAMVLTELNLIGLKWKDLGIEDPEKFPDALLNSWIKWLASNRPLEIQEFVLCRGPCAKEFSKWQQLPLEVGPQVADNLPREVWINISFNLRKKHHLPEIKEWQFEWDGRVVMLDAANKKVLFSYTMYEETKTWIGLEQKALNSALATGLYKAPLDAFQKIIKKVPQLMKLTRVNRLVVQGHQNLDDVLALIDLLKKEGGPEHLGAQLEFFRNKEAQIICFYQAEEKSFTDLLSRLKELKSSQRFKIESGNNGVLPVLKLIAE